MAANNISTTFRSSLNPNAPLFVPSSFQAVEDFSPQWWHLVKSSPDFRVYWMQEEEHQFMADDDISLPDELFDIENFTDIGEMQEHADKINSLESLGLDMKALTASKQSPAMKGWKSGQKQEAEKFMSKPVQIVPVPLSKTSIRRIQQPR